MSGIYQIRNIVNGKVYIGCTGRSFYSREYNHFYQLKKGTHDNPYLQHSFNKYGEESFVFEILEECGEDKLDELERKYFFDVPVDLRYNCKTPNYNKFGGSLSEEAKKKISAANRGKVLSKETRQKISESRMGEKHPLYGKFGKDHHSYGSSPTPETRAKISKALSGRPLTKETKRKLSKALSGENNPQYGKYGEDHPAYGYRHTKETIAKMSGENSPNFGKLGKDNPLSKPVKQIDIGTGEEINIFGCARDAAEKLGFPKSGTNISAVARGERKSAFGFSWEYL